LRHISLNKLKPGVVSEVPDVFQSSGQKVIYAHYLVALGDQTIANMRCEKSGSPGNHGPWRFVVWFQPVASLNDLGKNSLPNTMPIMSQETRKRCASHRDKLHNFAVLSHRRGKIHNISLLTSYNKKKLFLCAGIPRNETQPVRD
jgi:acetyl-CoA acetyltransferase